jgi:hypothetical protein
LFVSFVVGYLLKKLFLKYKAGFISQKNINYDCNSHETLYEELNNEEKNKEYYEKKKKLRPRVKGMTKAPGFVPEEHKFKTNKIEEKPSNLDEKRIKEYSESQNIIKSIKLEKQNNNEGSVEQINDNNTIKTSKKNTSSEGKVMKDNKKSNFLNDFEKDSLYALMGLVSDRTPRVKEDSIYSVEYLFGN